LAEEKVENVNIIAVFVDKNIYDSIESDIKSYTDYVQTKISRSKALVFPINTNNLKAQDIQKILENLYYE
jgi:hypothetical protein